MNLVAAGKSQSLTNEKIIFIMCKSNVFEPSPMSVTSDPAAAPRRQTRLHCALARWKSSLLAPLYPSPLLPPSSSSSSQRVV